MCKIVEARKLIMVFAATLHTALMRYKCSSWSSFNLRCPSFFFSLWERNIWHEHHVTIVCLRHVTKLKVYVRLKTRVKQVIWVQSTIKVLYGLNFYRISFTCHQWICFVLLLRRFGSKYIVRKRYDFKSGLFLNHLANPCILSVSRRYIRLHIHGRSIISIMKYDCDWRLC
jgi:hypothetical protein